MKVDVAIAGGGPAASAAAIALRRHGLTCAIVERGDGGGARVGESLAPTVKPLLDVLGLDLERDGHLPCHGHRSVWGSDTPVEMPFDLSPYGCGWHLDRQRFESRLAELAGVPRFTNTRVIDIERGWRLTCHSERSEEPGREGLRAARASRSLATLGMTIEAGFLIDATGRRAAVARRFGARIVRDDTLFAHVFFINKKLDDTYTHIEAEENGWWYRAPIPNGRTVAMFVGDRHSCLSFRDGQARVPVLHRDASSTRLDRVAGPRWLAIGDAAIALDPLSSHGLGNALFTGIRAAEAIVSGDIASYERAVDSVWTAYVSRRRELYAAERRWPSSPFWAKRYTPPS